MCLVLSANLQNLEATICTVFNLNVHIGCCVNQPDKVIIILAHIVKVIANDIDWLREYEVNWAVTDRAKTNNSVNSRLQLILRV